MLLSSIKNHIRHNKMWLMKFRNLKTTPSTPRRRIPPIRVRVTTYANLHINHHHSDSRKESVDLDFHKVISPMSNKKVVAAFSFQQIDKDPYTDNVRINNNKIRTPNLATRANKWLTMPNSRSDKNHKTYWTNTIVEHLDPDFDWRVVLDICKLKLISSQ